MRFSAILRLLLVSLAMLVPAAAQFSLPKKPAHVRASLVSELGVIAPGQPFTVWLRLEHDPHWHTYFVNPGSVGTPPSIQWTLPDGFKAGPLQWPVPSRLKTLEYIYGYEGVAYFPVVISPPADLATGISVSLLAHGKWQVCDDKSCDEGEADLRLDLVTAAEPVANGPAAAEVVAAKRGMPRLIDSWSVRAENAGDKIVISLTAGTGANPEPGEVYFFSSDQQVDAQIDQVVEKIPGGLRITATRAAEDPLGEKIPALPHLSGILRAENGWLANGEAKGLSLNEVAFGAGATKQAGTAAGQVGQADRVDQSGAKQHTLLAVLGLMFLGGLVLNVMPCVFPVIGIKIMGFVNQAGHDRRKVVMHGVVFAIGVLVSFWVLAALMHAGHIANWGSQMDDPRVVLATIVVMLLLGMNLFGVFEIGTSATGVGGSLTHKQGLTGTFFSGVLATVVSTPCSGPFLGVAIGVSSKLSGPLFFLAFTLMGLGLALPYLVLSIFPSLVDKLPRPGAWMESFKQGMSFLLFAAAGFFLWVYSAQVFDLSDQRGMWVMFGLATVAAAAWVYGRWSHPVRSRGARALGRIVALGLLAAGIALAWPWQSASKVETAEGAHVIDWQEWSQAKVDEALALGRPVYVDFTARWCLTCQVNKKVAYTAPVLALIKERNILMLRADKTRPNPSIDEALRILNRSAIPVNVLYAPGAAPTITPEVLTPEILIKLFTEGTKKPASQPGAP